MLPGSMPVQPAGIFPTFYTDMGKQQYTIGFFPRWLKNVFTRKITPTGVMAPNWWQVNCASAPVNYPWDASRSMAVTNCSNSGLNLVTAWYDGANAVWKESPNAMLFKTTGKGGNTFGRQLSVYPVPARDELHISGADEGDAYSVWDATGRKLKEGRLGSKGTIDIIALSAGYYQMRISNGSDGNTQTLRFTKQ